MPGHDAEWGNPIRHLRLRGGFAEALDDCRLTTLSRSEAVELAARQPGFAAPLIGTLSDRVLEADERMEYLAFHGSPARVAMGTAPDLRRQRHDA